MTQTEINCYQSFFVPQDAVKTVLRKHQIKPHWMFALDNLVGSAIQAVILVLQPELGAILVEQGQPDLGLLDQAPTNSVDQGGLRGAEAVAGHDLHHMEVDAGTGAESTSGVSTVNSGLGGHRESQGRLVSRLNRVRGDNRQLLADLLRAQADYHQLLKQSLAEQKLHLQMLSQNLAASSLQTRDTEGTSVTRPSGDRELVTWLQDLAIDDRSVDRFLSEDLTLNDVLELMNRDDLKRLGLKVIVINVLFPSKSSCECSRLDPNCGYGEQYYVIGASPPRPLPLTHEIT